MWAHNLQKILGPQPYNLPKVMGRSYTRIVRRAKLQESRTTLQDEKTWQSLGTTTLKRVQARGSNGLLVAAPMLQTDHLKSVAANGLALNAQRTSCNLILGFRSWSVWSGDGGSGHSRSMQLAACRPGRCTLRS
jgi:hypothetical protein